ncbi:hypothetical protein [Haliangium sp.]|uniref:hypothetical protein n=1 Tax=Haliangium sp. TaxID=2663208 RepID=UPI003D0E5B56
MKVIYFNVQPIQDVLRNNRSISERDREGLAKAICEAVETDKEGKAIAKVLESPQQFDDLLRTLGVKELVALCTGVNKEGFQARVKELELRALLSDNPVAAELIMAQLPLSVQAQMNRANRARANLIRTGGATDTLYPHIVNPAKRLKYGADQGCIVCKGADEHLPMLSESAQTRAVASILAGRIESAAGAGRKVLKEDRAEGKTVLRGYMLGVLRVGTELYIAISGSVLPSGLEAITGDYGTFVAASPERTTAGGAEIDRVYMEQSGGDSPAAPFMCAAPKLVGATRHLMLGGDQSWSMTEVWVGPSTEHRSTAYAYESCSNCQYILPMMLCLRAPVERTSSEGFTIVARSRSAKQDIRSGRAPTRTSKPTSTGKPTGTSKPTSTGKSTGKRR